ncbi:MAG: hypothetical protein ACOC7T_01260 [Planctomycetota bacterium]
MEMTLYIAGAANTDLVVERIRASFVGPWRADLAWPGRHDAALGVELWDEVRIEDDGGTVRFRGNLTDLAPGGVAEEGMELTARGKRFRLRNEPVRINGRGFYVWNRLGGTCEEGRGGYDSPGRDGGKWTAGEIVIDILEHAFGLPAAGSDISGHHSDACCVTDTFLTSSDVAGWTAADWLDLDSVIGEFRVDNTPIADAIDLLLGLNGGFYGWYVDPVSAELVLVDMDSASTTDVEAGQLGQWQDAAGHDYRLLDNRLEWSLDGVASTIVIQGADETTEEQPADIEGDGNAGKGDLGELERVAAPWRDWPAAYRPVCQDKRHACAKRIDMDNNYTPPAGQGGWGHLPRVYHGPDGGSKWVYEPPSGVHPIWLLGGDSAMVVFNEDPHSEVPYGEKLWGWYWARVPFTVSSGPDGDAYACYGYERTRTVYDPTFRHTTSYPKPGTADDETAMGDLADRLLRLYRDVRRTGDLVCDQADFSEFPLEQRYNVVNLTASGSACGEDPTEWSTLAINAVEVTWNLARERTEIRVANTFFMLEEYSELKDRLERNLFSKRNYNLSEDIYDCQVGSAAAEDPTTLAPHSTTTREPTTTTGGPTTTTTTAGPTTTTTGGPTTTTTTGGTTTTTTTGGPTTTTTSPPPCPTDCTDCATEYTVDVPAFTCTYEPFPGSPESVTFCGDYTWPDGATVNDCVWEGGPGTPGTSDGEDCGDFQLGDLRCGGTVGGLSYEGYWHFTLRIDTGSYCCEWVYRMPVRSDDPCPNGTYSLDRNLSGSCPDCDCTPPESLTVY